VVALPDELQEVGPERAPHVEVGVDLLADALDGHERLADHEQLGRHLDVELHRALDQVADERRDLDLLERAPEVALGETADLGVERRPVDGPARPAHREERLGERGGFAARRRDHEVDGLVAELGREPPDEPEVEEAEDRRVVGAEDEHVPRMRVGVEKAILEDHLRDSAERGLGDRLAGDAAGDRGAA